MDESEMRLLLSFGRAYRMLEAWVEADIVESAKKAVAAAFGASLEFKMVGALAGAEEPLRLSEIAARCGATRREMAREGSLRIALERMEREGMVINLASRRKPLYQLNLLSGESRLLVSLFARDGPPVVPMRGLTVRNDALRLRFGDPS